MRTALGQMDGNEWERYCQKILRLKYNDYQEIPDQFGGDLGVEGFTFSGIVFQCYCPDDDSSAKGLYENQRDKITKDISKLIKNALIISKMGIDSIKEWHFLTPKYNNRDLHSHCRSKEQAVISKGISVIHANFRIFLKSEDDYIPERQLFLGSGGHKVQPSVINLQSDELDKLMSSDNEIISNIKRKLRKLKISSPQREKLTRQLVNGYFVDQYEMQNLNTKYPSMYKSIVELKSATETQLAIRMLSSSDNHGHILSTILDDYEEKLSSEISYLHGALQRNLATGAISDWIGRCPLDFPDSKDRNENL